MRNMSPSALMAVAGVTALVGALKGLVGMGQGLMNMTSHFEQTQKGLETVMQSAEKGKALFEDLRKFSFQTTFGVDELASSATQLLNVGVGEDNLKGMLKQLGDLAQGDKGKFAELTAVMSKIESTGKAGAMQLNQLALRGIPIKQTLKDMGVQGTATAEDIERAFEKLTGAGGQFHDAMNNIIDTIEGKRGFITDTIKEIEVNFGAVSGLTDAYKKGLDLWYEALNKINNALAKMNENPFMKALMAGTVTTVLTGLVTVIGVALVGALKLVATQLGIIATLKAVINPASIGIALGVGAIAGLTVGINALKEKAEETNEEIKAFEESCKGFQITEMKTELELAQERIENINKSFDEMVAEGTASKSLEEIGNQLRDVAKMKEDFLTGEGLEGNPFIEDMEEYNNYYKNLQKWWEEQVLLEKEAIEKQKQLAVEEKKRKKQIEEENSLYAQQLSTVQKIYEKTNEGTLASLNSQIQKYQERLELGTTGNVQLIENEQYKDVKFREQAEKMGVIIPKFIQLQEYLTDEQKKWYEVALEQTKEQKKQLLEQIELQKKLNADGGWRKILQDALGLSDKDVVAGKLDNGGKAVINYLNDLNKQRQLVEKTNAKVGINTADNGQKLIMNELEEILSVYDAVMKSGKFGIDENGNLDKTTTEIWNAIGSLRNDFALAGGDIEEFDKVLNNLKEQLQDEEENPIMDAIKGFFASTMSGTDTGDIANIIQSVIKDGADPILMIVELLAKDLLPYMQILSPVLNNISYLLAGFEPLIKTIGLLLSPVALGFKAIGKGIEWLMKLLFGWAETLYDKVVSALDETTDSLSALNNQFKNLNSVLAENAEYYIEQKKKINSDTYAQSVQSVNDMILTPKGTFSTSPQDTIIAMKHPEQLSNGGVTMIQPIINDYGGNDVEVEQRTNADGLTELIVNISKKVASDYATGKNGWGSAYNQKQANLGGRRVF